MQNLLNMYIQALIQGDVIENYQAHSQIKKETLEGELLYVWTAYQRRKLTLSWPISYRNSLIISRHCD